jgi:hypothetical protein
MKNPFIENILQIPAEKRRGLTLQKNPKKQKEITEDEENSVDNEPEIEYNRPEKKDYTKEEILYWARKKCIYTQRDLKAAREEGDPSVTSVQRVFGNWMTFKQHLFQRFRTPDITKKLLAPPTDALYLCEIANRYSIRSSRHYEALRRLYPNVIPSIKHVRKEFGKWSNYKFLYTRLEMSQVVEKYKILMKTLDRSPTNSELKKEGLDITYFIKIHGSKSAFEKVLFLNNDRFEEFIKGTVEKKECKPKN